MSSIKNISDKSLLIILDGYGVSKNEQKNAVRDANTPNLDYYFANYPFTTITAGGEPVGLPKGVAGNSEVGHMNLGAGRPVRQDLVRINEAIENDTLTTMPKLLELIEAAKKNTKRIHLMGLLSDGGVHSHINHLKILLNSLSSHQDLEIFFHAMMDGRDTAQDVGAKYIEELERDVHGFTFASMQGRSIGMDRDRRWEKIKHAYDMMLGHGQIKEVSPLSYLKSEYEAGRFDEFIEPNLFYKNAAIQEGDCIFFINFRPDRAIQLALAFNEPGFKEFERPFIPPYYLCMTPYVPDEVTLPILFDKEKVPGGMSEYLSSLGKKQIKIAETEKYAHVTFFFNGGEKKPFSNEEHILIPSPKEVSTYDQKPEMSAPLVTERLLSELDSGVDFTLVNFANSDMVGHTGKYEAAVKAVEALDQCVKKLVDKCTKLGITVAITADHGNSDEMVYPDGSPHTSHTGAPVPFCVINEKLKGATFTVTPGEHALKDVSPTMLYIMGIDQPETFVGVNIFE
ncbi:2,3-bisphosphoglycerate-independent phosphoglycerate mutase [Bacteriovorax sp. Seq25_V]|uniref:2,3-bisphosphoglycerate-independent phosphoglycerate mutase n=1 Tax=Bacteriovorax sp. Seq25_V TaxID=1201288 RepID=UPI000389F6A0|nr:2,3-bisphosphoglycerate-independent phosphoglycerate mutase [Bacteriovorax sp. Seq25_V]EQC47428.1 2,3-bisphosphoglycerate-independent phosphoglycerate mutase [Bacteriovorax sp. Seq25_V]